MTRRLVLGAVSVSLFALIIVAVPFAVTLVRADRAQLEARVERDASVIASYVVEDLATGTSFDFQPIVVAYAQRTGGRAVITDAKGAVVADSDGLASTGAEDFSTRPEIAAALRGERATGHRFSSTLGLGLTYVAVPVASSGIVHGAVRITYASSDMDHTVRARLLALGVSVGIGLAAAALVAWAIARSINRPLADLAATATALADGDLAARADERDGPPELRAVASSFNEMADRIDELVGTQRAFVADASHQLRTPLTALRLRLDQLRSGTAPPESLDAALVESARLGRLVEGMLTLAKGEGARPERAPVNVASVIAERVAMWAPLADEVGVTLRATTIADWVLARSGALEQVLDNLLDNAIDHAPAGSTVEITTSKSGVWLDLHVTDHGPGLTADERARAFDRFWRGQRPTTGGSGLGLSIVRQLVVSSGGAATLNETPGGGLDVQIRLQVVPAALTPLS